MKFPIPSSDPSRLSEARRIATEYARGLDKGGVVGIAFLGAIVRGYFDSESDIDVTVFKEGYQPIISSDTRDRDGYPLHEFIVDYEREAAAEWPTGKRWAYSSCEVFWERNGVVSALLREKVPLGVEERKWLVMSGAALSEWYCVRLADSWVRRGDLSSAHHVFAEGLNHFFNLLFALNDELTPDHKWRLFCSKRLAILPADYENGLDAVMIMNDTGIEELERRKAAFLRLWRGTLPRAEAFLGMSYEDFKDKV